jgi:hypothetical protein
MKPGDLVRVWWNFKGSNWAKIVEVLPYDGAYPMLFDCVPRVQSHTRREYSEIAWNSKDNNQFNYRNQQ